MTRERILEFLRFCIVGFTAFCVDYSLLEMLVLFGMKASYARIGSIAVALQVSYLLHHRFTYRTGTPLSVHSWLKFLTSNLIGAGINYSMFLIVLHLNIFTDEQASRLIAMLAATATALFFNHWANRRFAFRHRGRDA